MFQSFVFYNNRFEKTINIFHDAIMIQKILFSAIKVQFSLIKIAACSIHYSTPKYAYFIIEFSLPDFIHYRILFSLQWMLATELQQKNKNKFDYTQ